MRMPTNKGFTMVEVLLAITILASISALMGFTLNSVFTSKEYFQERFERYQIVRNAMNRMVSEFGSGYIAGPQHGGQEIPGEESDQALLEDGGDAGALLSIDPIQFGFIGRDDQVSFTSFAHIRTQDGEKAGRHAEIGYFLRRAEDLKTGETVQQLVRREDVSYDDDITRGGVVYVMIPEVKDVKFEYWDPGAVRIGTVEELAEGRWVNDWDTTRRDQAARLPTRIRITVTLPTQFGSGDEVFVTQAFVNITEVLEF